MSQLFSPFVLRDVTLRNRIVVSPMCQYSSEDGFANDWHLVHLGSRAVGGAGLVFTEATAVTADGRISPGDLGIYRDEHVEMLSQIARFIAKQGAAPGIQLAHAGRKASTGKPWEVGAGVAVNDGGWRPVWAPSAIAFDETYVVPTAMVPEQIQAAVAAFVKGAERALAAGFQVIELHSAHGYLAHEFLSPLTNQRTDEYGGSFENRTRFTRELVAALRHVWPERLPLFVRISCTDWADGGWDIDQSVELARQLKPLGVDLIDASSGGAVLTQKIPVGPGYQTAFAQRIREEAGIPTGAVGMITSPAQAEHILVTGQADVVIMAREMLRDPYWPQRAAKELHAQITPPVQYGRAWM